MLQGVRKASVYLKFTKEPLARRLRYALDTLLSEYVGGHVTIGRVTIFGHNAMHWAVNVRTHRWGSVCFRPTTISPFGSKWRWYFYVSPNGTPWASTFAVGPGLDHADKAMAHVRRYLFGHNFNTDFEGFIEWNRTTSDEFEAARFKNLEKQLL